MADHESDPQAPDSNDDVPDAGRTDADEPVDADHDRTDHDDDPHAEPATAETAATPPEPVPMARLHGASKHYGSHRAIGPLDLTIEPGCTGLLGPNGAGKTTLIRMLMGLLPPDEGRLELLGSPVEGDGRHVRRRIGYVPEGDVRFPGLTGVRAVEYAGRLVGMEPAAAIQRAHQVLDYVGLGEARYRDASTYSTGMKQRLKMAQALVHDPELLILDEPTEGVDPEAREDILALITELARDHGLQILLCTHLLHDVERVASHAVVLHKGRVVEQGPIANLRTAADRGYQVRVNGPSDALIQRLHKHGIAAEWMGNTLRVQTQDATALLAHIAACDLVVRHMSPIELSLDEVFETAVRNAPMAAPAVPMPTDPRNDGSHDDEDNDGDAAPTSPERDETRDEDTLEEVA